MVLTFCGRKDEDVFSGDLNHLFGLLTQSLQPLVAKLHCKKRRRRRRRATVEMELSPSPSPTSLVVRSPGQTLSLLRNRRPHHEPPRSPSTPTSFTAGPKPSEVYGLVGSITTVVYLVWAYTPELYLHSLGITYYPSKYWALAVPSFVMVAVALSMIIYMGFNFLATPPPTSFNTIFDEHSRERTMFSPVMEAERPTNPFQTLAFIK